MFDEEAKLGEQIAALQKNQNELREKQSVNLNVVPNINKILVEK